MPTVTAARPSSRPGTAKPPKRSQTLGEKRFDQFKAKLNASAPKGLERGELRQLAKSLFGDAAFGDKAPGDDARPLKLGNEELRFIAEHPKKLELHLRRLQRQGLIGKGPKGWTLEESAKLYARIARDVVPPKTDADSVALKIATVNDDFTDRKTNLKRVHADVMLVQEAKNTNIRGELSKKSHGVHQDTARDDKAGSAVVWKKDAVDAKDRGYALGVRPNGAKMLTRWISYTDVKVDGVQVRMISVHRPPKRYARLWPQFDRQLEAFVKNTRGPVVVGMDANQRDPRALAKLTGLRWHAPEGSIDGFLVSPGIKVSGMRRLPKGTSDHHPVVAHFEIDRPNR